MRIAIPLALAALASGCAAARHDEDLPRYAWEEKIVTTISAYAWDATADVDITAAGIESVGDDVDEDVVRGARFETHLDRVSLLLDGFWVHADATSQGVEGDARYGRFDLSVAMRIHGPEPLPPRERPFPAFAYVDGLAGVRTHFASLDVDPPGFEEVDDDVLWLEPMGGLRVGVVLLRRFTIEGRADVSGIGYNGFTSFSTNAEVNLRVDLAVGLGAFVGARYARIDARDDDDDDGFDETALDLRLEGIQAGILWEF